jgi:predicted metal-binding membrane protein
MRISPTITGAPTASSAEARSLAETLLTRDRWIAGLAIALICCLSWAWILPMSRDMYGPMTGASAWMMRGVWDAPHLVLLFAMWLVMMVGMMLPSAAPTVLLYAMVVRKDTDGGSPIARVYAFLCGYLLCWTGFSLAATALQRGLSAARWLSPMMELQNRPLSATVLIVAGLYQLTPLKRGCLRHCRAPVAFISEHWHPGMVGALRMGAVHGLYCLGCCWALMLLLFAGGVMNLLCIALLTLLVLLEKLAPFGQRTAALAGFVLIVAGAAIALS